MKSKHSHFFETDKYLVNLFLNFVVNRQDDISLRQRLLQDPSLIVKRGTVSHSSGTFSNISAFEYAFWAKDKHLWTMMLCWIPENEKGLVILEELLVQLEAMEKEPISYMRNNELITEKHFDLDNTLIKALQEYLDIKESDALGESKLSEKWREGVGIAQSILPKHVIHEYVADRVFSHDFTKEPEIERGYTWYWSDKWRQPAAAVLGVDYAILKVLDNTEVVENPCDRKNSVKENLTAMQALSQERTKDCYKLKAQLEMKKSEIAYQCDRVRNASSKL
jgi:membrane-bound inhibitor of C-type lysozyme